MSELGYSYSLNLDSDVMQPMPANLTQADWSSGITLPDGVITVAASEGRPVTIAGTSTQVEPLRDGVMAWERQAPTDIRLPYELEKGQTVTVSGEANSLPLTFAFRTQAGTSGLLQVTSFTEKPRGVKIRYKLMKYPTTEIPLPPGYEKGLSVPPPPGYEKGPFVPPPPGYQ